VYALCVPHRVSLDAFSPSEAAKLKFFKQLLKKNCRLDELFPPPPLHLVPPFFFRPRVTKTRSLHLS